jgi:hypothetical protein
MPKAKQISWKSIFMACTGRSHKTSQRQRTDKWGKGRGVNQHQGIKQLGASEIAISLSNAEIKKGIN